MRAKNIVISALIGLIYITGSPLLVWASIFDSEADITQEASEEWARAIADDSMVDNFCNCKNESAKKSVCVKIRIPKNKTSFVDRYNACADFGENTDWMVLDNLLVENSAWTIGTDVGVVGYLLYGNMNGGEKLRQFNDCTSAGETETSCQDAAQAVLSQFGITGQAPAPKSPQKPVLEMTIPGLELSTVPKIENGVLYLPWIAEYVASVFKYGIIVASVLAVVLIIIQGIKITISGGGEKKSEAYKTIARVIIGLIIAWSSYAILYTINPNLVRLKTLAIEVVLPEMADQEIMSKGLDQNNTGSDKPEPGGECITEQNGGVNIKKIGLKNIDVVASVPLLTKDASEALKQVDMIVERIKTEKNRPNLKLQITSAGRTMASAQKLWEKAVRKYGDRASTYAAPPSCKNSHNSGRAVDISIVSSYINNYFNWHNASYWDNNDIALLATIMHEAGWKRYCGEWWHYEYNSGITAKRTDKPGKC